MVTRTYKDLGLTGLSHKHLDQVKSFWLQRFQ